MPQRPGGPLCGSGFSPSVVLSVLGVILFKTFSGRCFSVSSVACTHATDEIENARCGCLAGRCFLIPSVACTHATDGIENARCRVFGIAGSSMPFVLLLLLSSGAWAGPAVDAGALASVLMWDTHPTVYAVLASLCGLAAAVWGLRRVLRALGGSRG